MRIAGDFGNMHSFDSPFCIPWFTKSATIHIAYVGFLWIMRVLLWRELKMMPLIYFLTLCNMHALLFQRHTDDEKMMYQAFFVGNSHIIKFEAFWSPFSEITASQLSVWIVWCWLADISEDKMLGSFFFISTSSQQQCYVFARFKRR